MQNEPLTADEKEVALYLLHHFKIEGKFADEMATEGQIEIFYNLVFRPYKRLQILCSTQYGKSLFVALACLIIACVQRKKVAIIAPTTEKAKIIMRYFTGHLADHEIFYSELDKDSKLDRLRMEENKERITMKHGGGIFIISVQAGNSIKGTEAAMGAGAEIVIQDESGLIPDQIESTVFRMIAGKGEEAFYCKIGNPFYRNHFYKSSKDPLYHQIFIDDKRGVKEGRYNALFLAEAKRKPMYDILYECKFPGEGMMDQTGFLNLIGETRVELRPKMVTETLFIPDIAGSLDPAGEGKDEATFAIRDRFKVEIVHTLKTSNEKQLAEICLTLMDKYKINPKNFVIDAFGVGTNIGKHIAIASKGKIEVYTPLVGSSPKDEQHQNGFFFTRKDEEIIAEAGKTSKECDDLYLNLRALMYFRLRSWLLAGGQLVEEDVENPIFRNEVLGIKYKRSLQGNKIQLMSKKDMLTLGITSPNKADAAALTFLVDIDSVSTQTDEEREEILDQEKDYDRHAVI